MSGYDDFRPTHVGWWWFCPVYLDMSDEELPVVEERHWAFIPLFYLAELLEFGRIFFTTLFNRDYEPVFWYLITGEITSWGDE